MNSESHKSLAAPRPFGGRRLRTMRSLKWLIALAAILFVHDFARTDEGDGTSTPVEVTDAAGDGPHDSQDASSGIENGEDADDCNKYVSDNNNNVTVSMVM